MHQTIILLVVVKLIESTGLFNVGVTINEEEEKPEFKPKKLNLFYIH